MTRILRAWMARAGGIFGKRRRDAELAAEIESNLQLHIEENLRRGMTPEEARRQALIRLGGVEQTMEAYRERRGLPWLDMLAQDARYGLRMLWRNPGFTATAILTLALGIGANAAIFNAVNTVLLAPLPFRDVDRLVMVWGMHPQKESGISPVSGGDLTTWRAENHVFEQMAGSTDELYTLTGAGDPELLIAYDYSADYFHVIGTTPELGRTFTAEEDQPGGPHVAVLSDKLWRRKFGADPGIVGKSITLTGELYTVIGVMPPGFNHPGGIVQVWTPIQLPAKYAQDYKKNFLRVIARRRPGVSVAAAQKEMNAIAARIAQLHPDTHTGQTVKVTPLREEISGDARLPLLVLLCAVGFVLLIVCANLLLARAASRMKETAIRATLGASRGRLVRQFLTESLLLSALGGLAGILLARVLTGFLAAIFPNNIANLNIPQVTAIPMDARVLGFSILLTAVAGILFGVLPALRSAKANVNEALKEEGRGASAGGRQLRQGNFLVVSEVALALMLLAGAGLLIESFARLTRSSLGMKVDHVVSMTLFLSLNQYPADKPEKREEFIEKVIQQMQAAPGVESAGATNFLPLIGFWDTTPVAVEGRPPAKPGEELEADARLASPDYFQTMGISLLQGREFTAQDVSGSPHVVIVNATLAREISGKDSPVGKRLNLGEAGKPDLWEVVGVAEDVKSFGLNEKAHAELFRPMAQIPSALLSFTARTAGNPDALVHELQQVLWKVDAGQAVFKTVTMQELANESMAMQKTSTMLLAGFSALALLLAAVGTYGVVAYGVAQRTHEIGIRLALGATPADVLRMVMRRGLLLTLVGIGVGLAGALALTRLMANMLFDVKPTDPAALAGAMGLLTLVALAACWIPARRAMRVNPMTALRHE